jgi:hypothetical protein
MLVALVTLSGCEQAPPKPSCHGFSCKLTSSLSKGTFVGDVNTEEQCRAACQSCLGGYNCPGFKAHGDGIFECQCSNDNCKNHWATACSDLQTPPAVNTTYLPAPVNATAALLGSFAKTGLVEAPTHFSVIGYTVAMSAFAVAALAAAVIVVRLRGQSENDGDDEELLPNVE